LADTPRFIIFASSRRRDYAAFDIFHFHCFDRRLRRGRLPSFIFERRFAAVLIATYADISSFSSSPPLRRQLSRHAAGRHFRRHAAAIDASPLVDYFDDYCIRCIDRRLIMAISRPLFSFDIDASISDTPFRRCRLITPYFRHFRRHYAAAAAALSIFFRRRFSRRAAALRLYLEMRCIYFIAALRGYDIEFSRCSAMPMLIAAPAPGCRQMMPPAYGCYASANRTHHMLPAADDIEAPLLRHADSFRCATFLDSFRRSFSADTPFR